MLLNTYAKAFGQTYFCLVTPQSFCTYCPLTNMLLCLDIPTSEYIYLYLFLLLETEQYISRKILFLVFLMIQGTGIQSKKIKDKSTIIHCNKFIMNSHSKKKTHLYLLYLTNATFVKSRPFNSHSKTM
jgi:hypothetical protein